jgi:hypothetical protein
MFARHAILDVLALETGDRLPELDCGRGSPPRRRSRGRCECEVLHHSEEMVEIARSARPAEVVLSRKAPQLWHILSGKTGA